MSGFFKLLGTVWVTKQRWKKALKLEREFADDLKLILEALRAPPALAVPFPGPIISCSLVTGPLEEKVIEFCLFFLWAVLLQTAFPYAGVAGGCSLLFGGGDACPVRAKLGSKGLWYYATAINAQPWSCIRLYASSPGIALTKLLRALKKLWWLQIICTWVENNGLDSYEYTADLKWCGQSELGQKDLSWV